MSLTATATSRNRESSFELLRLIAQWMIVLYHLLYFYFYPLTGLECFKAAWLPLHISVVLYVLISGYFGIHPTVKGLVKLIAVIAVYTVPLLFYSDVANGESLKKTLLDFLFVSRTPFWFVRTYLYLYLLSPVLNNALKERRMALYLLCILSIISIYVGTVGNDSSLRAGKDILTFILIYVIGHELKRSKTYWGNWKKKKVLLIWIVVNLFVVSLWYISREAFVGKVVWKLCYPYNSPILIANATLFFVLFGLLRFKSVIVNTIATSAFAGYLIHTHPFIRYQILAPMCSNIVNNYDGVALIGCIFLLSLCVVAVAIVIDKALYPLWYSVSKLGEWCDRKLGGRYSKLTL